MKYVRNGVGSFSVYDASLNLVGTVNFTDDTDPPPPSKYSSEIAPGRRLRLVKRLTLMISLWITPMRISH